MSKKKDFNPIKALKKFIFTFVGTLCVGAVLVGVYFPLGIAVTLLAIPEIVISTIIFIKRIDDGRENKNTCKKEIQKVIITEDEKKQKQVLLSCKSKNENEKQKEMEM